MSAEQTSHVVRAINGDRHAFDLIVQEYQARIARYLLRMVGDHEAALDLTQDTFVHAYRRIQAVRSPEAFSAWLYRIATNLAIQARARSMRLVCQPFLDEHGAGMGVSESPDRAVINRDMVESALAHLPHDRAACLLLHINEGFSYEEVAAIVNSTPEAVRKRIARAKQQFRLHYDAACQEASEYAVR